jgi:hypothetical protein
MPYNTPEKKQQYQHEAHLRRYAPRHAAIAEAKREWALKHPDRVPMTRAEARAAGLVSYWPSLPCKRNHSSERLVKGPCVECQLEAVRENMRGRRSTEEGREALNAVERIRAKTPEGKARATAKTAARRAAKKGAMPRWADPQFAKEERQALAAMHKGKPRHTHLDHIYPLAGATYSGPDPEWQGVQISVGLEVSWNYQYLPDWLNESKGAKPPPPGLFDWAGHDDEKPPRAAVTGEWAGWPEEYYD